jgi:hypothetical protein
MSQRHSGYARVERDHYPTPAWVTEAILPHIPARVRTVWEPTCGGGHMVEVLRSAGYGITATDIETGVDFLACSTADVDAIICNPPYKQAQEFIEHAIELMRPAGFVAMILRTDFDHAKCRRHLFQNAPAFAKKVALTERVRWFPGTKTQPSFNHSWFVWDHRHVGPATLAYASRGDSRSGSRNPSSPERSASSA